MAQIHREGFTYLSGEKSPSASGFAINIIFVHGLRGHPRKTWESASSGDGQGSDVTKKSGGLKVLFKPKLRETPPVGAPVAPAAEQTQSSKIFWPRQYLVPEIPEARIWTYGYNADVIGGLFQADNKNSISQHGRDLAAKLKREIENDDPIVFVAHSLGGLLVKYAINRSDVCRNRTKLIVFLGTPHRGSAYADWGRIASNIARLALLDSNKRILKNLKADSEVLDNIHDEFKSIAHESAIEIHSFQEARGITGIKGLHGKVVDDFSSKLGLPRNLETVESIDANHMQMARCCSKDDPGYRAISGVLKHFLRKELAKNVRSSSGSIAPVLSTGPQRFYSVQLETVVSYTERRNLSSMIEEKLRQSRDDDCGLLHALAIYGFGGSGKTQLALNYIKNHKEEYNPILWIDAKSPETVRSSFERCASELGLAVAEASTQRSALKDSPTIQSVLRWLRNRGESDSEWLVVIDNADDPTWGIREIVPGGIRGSVVITSQDNQSPRLFNRRCESVHVDKMDPSEAKSLLLWHLKWDLDSAPNDIRDVASKIVDLLDYLALAVDLAGAYINENLDWNAVKEGGYVAEVLDQKAALGEYLNNWNRHRDDILRNRSSDGLSSYKKTVWTVWDTSLEAIEERYPEVQASLFLTFLAHFNSGNIQDELFRLASLGLSKVAKRVCPQDQNLPPWLKEIITVQGQEWDRFCFQETRKPLIRYGLLQRVDGEWPGVTMHSLVQWRAKYEKDQNWDLYYLAFTIAAAYQVILEKSRPQFRRHLVMHLTLLSKLDLENIGIDDERKAFIWNTTGRVYYEEGRWKEAEELFMQVVETTKRVLGQEHPDTLTCMNNLALTYKEQGRWKEAEDLGIQVLDIRKRVLEQEHPDTLISMDSLALIYWQQGRWKDAEDLGIQVLDIRKRVLEQEHPDTLASMDSLALTYKEQGRWKEAEDLGIQVLDIRKRVSGQEHPDTLTSMNNLAWIYWHQKRWKDAEDLEIQVLDISKRVLGQEHPDTLASINNLALIYQEHGRWKEAEELNIQTLEIEKRVLGHEHPDTLISMNNLAWTFKMQGRDGEASELMKECVQLQKHRLGPDHPYTLDSVEALNVWENEGTVPSS